MSEPRVLCVPVGEILSLVARARSYRFEQQVLFDAFGKFAGWVKDEEIDAFLHDEFLSPEQQAKGYTQEDADEAMAAIVQWRRDYAWTDDDRRDGGVVDLERP